MITNTKGFTGHAMGAGIEDVVAIKALETGIVPPVPNYKEPDPDLGELNLSTGGAYPVEYALRLAAGFGSQIAMSLLRLDAGARRPAPRAPASSATRTASSTRRPGSAGWTRCRGHAEARLEVDHRRLRVVDVGAPATARAAPHAGRPCRTPTRRCRDRAPAPAPAPAGRSGRAGRAGRARPAAAPG